jgi:hypothetical protein
MAFSAWRFHRRGSLVLRFYNGSKPSSNISGLPSKTRPVSGRRIFPVVGTIFMLIFVANMIKLVPGFEASVTQGSP